MKMNSWPLFNVCSVGECVSGVFNRPHYVGDLSDDIYCVWNNNIVATQDAVTVYMHFWVREYGIGKVQFNAAKVVS